MDLLDELYLLIGNPINTKKLRWIDPTIIERIVVTVPLYPGTKLTERLYWLANNLQHYPSCIECGCQLAGRHFKTYELGYRRFCSPKCSANNVQVKAVSKDTVQTKYGTHHSRLAETRTKRMATIRAKYGDNGPTLISNKGKSKRVGLQKPESALLARTATRHNKWWPTKLQSVIDSGVNPLFDPATQYTTVDGSYLWECNLCKCRMTRTLLMGKLPECPVCCPTYSADKLLFQWIQSVCSDAEYVNRTVIKPRELDIYIPSIQVAVEYNGLYWHHDGQPNQYPRYHLQKTERCAEQGIRLVHIFEDEWISKPDIVKSRLCVIFNSPTQVSWNARQLHIQNVDKAIARQFLIDNHIQGKDSSKIRLGLFSDTSELIGLMTFCVSRFNNKYQWELSRFCTKLNNRIRGGASRLFTSFIRQYLPTSVVSYSDRRWGEGEVYKHLGFTRCGVSAPSYFYMDNKFKCRYNRMIFQKHKLVDLLPTFNPAWSESTNMMNAGYKRIWDCGSVRYVWAPPNQPLLEENIKEHSE